MSEDVHESGSPISKPNPPILPPPPGQPPAPGPVPAEIVIGTGSLAPLSDASIDLIHDGLEIPNEHAIISMAREIRKWRGNPNPDAL